ncbi:MAG: GNAT family N-acetyltransferase [Acidobacteriota bacterium]|nr:GNAT family N-acetyltransferase [Acidobacteriota bacterium]
MTILRFDVRAATRRDWRELRALRLEALLDTPEAFGSTYAESLRRTRRQWKMMARDFNYYVAHDGATFLGMASGGRHDDFPGTAWLYGMYVTPEARGTRVASELVGAVASWARASGYGALYLHVGAQVARARRFYRRVGFVETGDQHVMSRDPALTLLTMRLDLP